jgi:Fic family protein
LDLYGIIVQVEGAIMSYKPPFTINEKTINLVAEIMEAVTKLTLDEVEGINPKLRRNNRIKTIQASLAIENNSLSIDQVTAILNGK